MRRPRNGYACAYLPAHPRASKSGEVYAHVAIAERAIGNLLPDGAEVHHVDGDTTNNAPRNLVICQDKAYHKLLHVRAKVVAAGGNPNTQKVCCDCGRPKDFAEFNAMSRNLSTGRQSACRICSKARDRAKRARRAA